MKQVLKNKVKKRIVNFFCTIMFSSIFLASFSQQNNNVSIEENKVKIETDTTVECEERMAINIGILMGGGGIVGADLEFMVGKHMGLQIGCGFGSMGFGLNYHFKPEIKSPFISFQYWHQGFSDNHYASYLGPVFVFRNKKKFQCCIGYGSILTKGTAWKKFYADKKEPAIGILLYNIGWYLRSCHK